MDPTTRKTRKMHGGTVMPILIWKYKNWIAIAIFLVLYLVQIAYTNHLAGELKDTESKCSAKILKIEQDHQKALLDKQNEINKVSSDYEAEKSKQKVRVGTVTREVQKIIERPVYLNACFDDDGLSKLNSLITGGAK